MSKVVLGFTCLVPSPGTTDGYVLVLKPEWAVEVDLPEGHIIRTVYMIADGMEILNAPLYPLYKGEEDE